MVNLTLKNLPPKSCVQITVKGYGEQSIFLFPVDYENYFKLLAKYKIEFGIKIYGFCLMPDYVHLVLQADDSLDLSRFLKTVNEHYALYFNEKYERRGRLWNKDIRSLVIRRFPQLVHCLNDIELEPVRASLSQSPIEYLWSSYLYRILYVRNEAKSQSYASVILDPIALVRGVFLPSSHDISPTLRSISRDIRSRVEKRPILKLAASLGIGE